MKQKHAEKDFTTDLLPSTRKEVFFDRIKLQYGKLLKIGLICFAFSVPLLVIAILKDFGIAAVFAEYESGNIDYEQAKLLTNSAENMFNLFSLAGYCFLSVGISGCMQVIKRLAWIEPVFFGQDFRSGIKSNWLTYLFVFALFGALLFFGKIALRYFDNFFLSVLPMGVLLAIFLPVMLFMLSQNCIYSVKFFENLRNSFLLYLKTVPGTLLSIIVMALPTLFLMIENMMLKYVFLVFAVVFWEPLALLFWFLYSCYIFDQNINFKQFPELMNKGLQIKKEKE